MKEICELLWRVVGLHNSASEGFSKNLKVGYSKGLTTQLRLTRPRDSALSPGERST